MAKRRSRRVRVRIDSNAAQFARAGNPWDASERELVVRRGEHKASNFGPARKIATCGENRNRSETFLDIRAVAKMKAMRAALKAPVAFVEQQKPRVALKPVVEKPEPTSYPAPKPLVEPAEVRAKARTHWERLRAEWEAVLKSPLSTEARRKRAAARIFSIDTELELLA